jgi:hypothetical protein
MLKMVVLLYCDGLYEWTQVKLQISMLDEQF